jgi:hypothetical protein
VNRVVATDIDVDINQPAFTLYMELSRDERQRKRRHTCQGKSVTRYVTVIDFLRFSGFVRIK